MSNQVFKAGGMIPSIIIMKTAAPGRREPTVLPVLNRKCIIWEQLRSFLQLTYTPEFDYTAVDPAGPPGSWWQGQCRSSSRQRPLFSASPHEASDLRRFPWLQPLTALRKHLSLFESLWALKAFLLTSPCGLLVVLSRNPTCPLLAHGIRARSSSSLGKRSNCLQRLWPHWALSRILLTHLMMSLFFLLWLCWSILTTLTPTNSSLLLTKWENSSCSESSYSMKILV